MAENILGLLLVTQSSRGRAVFRYPPDPASPNIRLAQPIYPSATFTATDFDVDYKNPHLGVNNATQLRRRLFGEDGRTSSAASLRKSRLGGDKSDSNRRKKQNKVHPMYYDANSTTYDSEEDDEDGDEDSDGDSSLSSDEDSDYDVVWSHQRNQNQRSSTNDDNNNNNNGNSQSNSALRSIDSSIVIDASRRGSGSTVTDVNNNNNNNGYNHTHNNNNSNSNGNDAKKEKETRDLQYNYALGYHLDFLSDMLTPPRAACNRKFEICVGSVVFLGHPVCSGPDGKWTIPKDIDDQDIGDDDQEDQDNNLPSRGRRTREQVASQPSNLGPLVEHRKEKAQNHSQLSLTSSSTSSPETPNPSSSHSKQSNSDQDDTPNLNMFHLVLIIDKPDPKPGTEAHDEHHHQTLGMYDEVYREIAFKWTAAAWKLQCESNFVAKQTWVMAKYKEKCLSEGVDVTECCRWMYANMPLDRSLNSLYLRLHQLKNQPSNPLHSYLPTTITTQLADMTVHTILSPKVSDADEAWAHWGEIEDQQSESEISDSDDEDYYDDLTTPIRRPELKVEPWQTLLLIDEDAAKRATEISTAIIGLGVGMEGQNITNTNPYGSERRGSKPTLVTAQDQEDETQLMKQLIQACDVTKPLVDIAHLLRFDLDAIVIPLARELVENKKAILVDVINTRLRTIVMPTTIDDHNVSIEQYTARFSREYPNLPTFPAFISQISSSPTPFRDILPSDPDLPTRKLYMSALIWLLRQDIVVQVHTRARVYARKEIKVEAWKRLWRRRREKWLKLQEKQKELLTKSPTGSDLITPRASENPINNPLDSFGTSMLSTVPSPKRSDYNNNNIGPYGGLDRSFLDYDPALEMDSDEDVNSNDNNINGNNSISDKFSHFKIDQDEPLKSEIPKFQSSFIFKPARAQKDESRWLRVVRESNDEVTASKFDLVVQYLDGTTTFEEISYRTGLPRRELDRIINLYKEDIITFVHP
ncbi:uncharacterized protein L201_006016 [Kwoniella dendrophila CBS 6074]|uniref:Nitrogen permease regulator 3 n=1 Tax=Kwoniella dendrophila CBS 6074 TaxID=1295534 RepID=A0AAX4K0B2_9TREE